MEGEIKNLLKVWFAVFISLIYCYYIPIKLPKGKTRLVSLLPIITLFTLLPLKFSSVNLSGNTGFFISWLANFKLLLFAFDQGPLSSHPFITFRRFICTACFPIKIKQTPSPEITNKSSLNYAAKVVLLGLLFKVYDYKQHIHPTLLLLLYCFHIYFSLEIMLVVTSTLGQTILRVELEPPFNEPHFSTSLQDFWGNRWNLMVTSILRPTVYNPVRHRIGGKWGSICGVLMTFVVSGLMHELIFFYFCRVWPTWEVMGFFLLHGVCLVVEILVKKRLNGKWRLHPVLSIPLTCGFVMVTSFWLFFPQMLRCDVDVRALKENEVVIGFVKGMGRTVIDYFV